MGISWPFRRKWTWEQTLAAINSRDVGLAVAAVEQLHKLADNSRISELYRLIRDPSFFVREAVAVPLAELEGAQALRALFDAIQQGYADGHDNDGLTNTIAGLLEDHADDCRPVLLEMLRSDKPIDREHAAWAWGYIHNVAPVDPLLELLSMETVHAVRADAIGSLASFTGDERVFLTLISATHDANQDVRLSAISSLGFYKDFRAEPVLKEATGSDDQLLQSIAKQALRHLREKH